jgi:hypothetical protein
MTRLTVFAVAQVAAVSSREVKISKEGRVPVDIAYVYP